MFGSTEVKQLKKENSALREIISDKNDLISRFEESKEREINSIKDELNRTIRNLEIDLKDSVRSTESKINLGISEGIEKLTKDNNTLLKEKGILEEKVTMYEKAFENMGFDVKDMKEILNKLADAVVAKNEVKIIK